MFFKRFSFFISVFLLFLVPSISHSQEIGKFDRFTEEISSETFSKDPSFVFQKTLRLGDSSSDVVVLKRLLGLSYGEIPELFDSFVESSVKNFQRRHALKDDGVFGKDTALTLTLSPFEKNRRFQETVDFLKNFPVHGKAILVNMAFQKIYLVEEGKIVHVSPVIVGKPGRETPRLSTVLTSLKVNPDWHPPETIIRKDILPDIASGSYRYVKSHGLYAYDQTGDVVDWSIVTVEDYKSGKYRFRQSPGEDNALGVVKFELRNSNAIYLHDTNNRSLFFRSDRRLSSGCVRVKEWKVLADWILQDRASEFELALKSKNTKYLSIQEIPVFLVSLKAFPEGDTPEDLLKGDFLYVL